MKAVIPGTSLAIHPDRFPDPVEDVPTDQDIGRAVLANPDVLLLDEPFAAVDSARTQRIAGHLRAHVDAAGIAMIAVSHHRETLDALTDQTIHLPAIG